MSIIQPVKWPTNIPVVAPATLPVLPPDQSLVDLSGSLGSRKTLGVSTIPKVLIVEGIDNVGKSTFIDAVIRLHGFRQVIKFDKPKPCLSQTPKQYQQASFEAGFDLIEKAISSSKTCLIFDRFHLGEVVYSPLYRGYSGDYVMDLEKEFAKRVNGSLRAQICLLFLKTSDFSIITDDGKSFDPKKQEIEQSLFQDTFDRSVLPKICLDVSADSYVPNDTDRENVKNGFVDTTALLNEFKKKYESMIG